MWERSDNNEGGPKMKANVLQDRGSKRKQDQTQPAKKKANTNANLRSFKTSRQFSTAVVPHSLPQIQELDGIFEWNNESVRGIGIWDRRRPLPAMSILATATPPSFQNSTDKEKQHYERRGLRMPLIQKFLEDLRENNSFSDSTRNEAPLCSTKENQTEESSLSHEVIPMEDPNLSTLTKGQHDRFLRLLGEKRSGKSWNQNKVKEFSRLSRSVRDEQQLYREAHSRFIEDHLKNFKVGFDQPTSIGAAFSSKVALLNSKQIQHYKWQWEKIYGKTNHYGKCTQTISTTSGNSLTSNSVSNLSQLDSLILENRVVHTEGMPAELSAGISLDCFQKDSPMPLDGFDIATITNENWPRLLASDPVAHRLALEHKVELVTCLETLHEVIQKLLATEAQPLSSWMAPVSFQGGVVYIDLLVPQACSDPRQCLTKGYEVVLKEAMKSRYAEGCQTKSSSNHYVYSLLTVGVPNTGPRHGKIKMLVRSKVDLVLSKISTSIYMHAHLDYFDGQEECFTAAEKAAWILDKVVHPTCRVLVGRVSPNFATVNAFEDMTHAIVHRDDSVFNFTGEEPSPVDYVQGLFHLLHSTLRLERGKDQILCWPGRHVLTETLGISVHKKETEHTDEYTIDLHTELDEASLVRTSSIALRQCARSFKWPHQNRIPFTFAVESTSSNMKDQAEK